MGAPANKNTSRSQNVLCEKGYEECGCFRCIVFDPFGLYENARLVMGGIVEHEAQSHTKDLDFSVKERLLWR